HGDSSHVTPHRKDLYEGAPSGGGRGAGVSNARARASTNQARPERMAFIRMEIIRSAERGPYSATIVVFDDPPVVGQEAPGPDTWRSSRTTSFTRNGSTPTALGSPCSAPPPAPTWVFLMTKRSSG